MIWFLNEIEQVKKNNNILNIFLSKKPPLHSLIFSYTIITDRTPLNTKYTRGPAKHIDAFW